MDETLDTTLESHVAEQVGPSDWMLEEDHIKAPSLSGPPRVFPRPEGPSASNETSIAYSVQTTPLMWSMAHLFLGRLNSIYQLIDADEVLQLMRGEHGDHTLSDQLFIHAICAAGACFSGLSNARVVARMFLREAESKVLSACRSDVGLRALQSLIILTWCEITLDDEFVGWTYNCKL